MTLTFILWMHVLHTAHHVIAFSICAKSDQNPVRHVEFTDKIKHIYAEHCCCNSSQLTGSIIKYMYLLSFSSPYETYFNGFWVNELHAQVPVTCHILPVIHTTLDLCYFFGFICSYTDTSSSVSDILRKKQQKKTSAQAGNTKVPYQ